MEASPDTLPRHSPEIGGPHGKRKGQSMARGVNHTASRWVWRTALSTLDDGVYVAEPLLVVDEHLRIRQKSPFD